MAGLHYILQTSEESEVARSLHAFTRFPKPGLVKLLALSNFQARRSLRDSSFTGHFDQFSLFVIMVGAPVICCDRLRALVTGLERNDCSAPILLLSAPSMASLRNSPLVFDSLDLRKLIGVFSFKNCVLFAAFPLERHTTKPIGRSFLFFLTNRLEPTGMLPRRSRAEPFSQRSR